MSGRTIIGRDLDPASDVRTTTDTGVERWSFDDPAVSRRHAELDASGPILFCRDLGSANGTFVNGVRTTGTVPLMAGAVVRLGDSELVVGTAEPVSLAGDGVVVRARPGSYGERVAAGVAATAANARAALRGVGDEPQRGPVVVHLVDYLPDSVPADDEALDGIAGMSRTGVVVDRLGSTLWVAATAEAPPGDLDRADGRSVRDHRRCRRPVDPVGRRVRGMARARRRRARAAARPGRALPRRSTGRPACARSPIVRASPRPHRGRGGGAAGDRRTDRHVRPTIPRRAFGRSFARSEDDWADEALAGNEASVGPMQFARLSLRLLRPHLWRQLEVFGYMLLSLAFGAAYPFVSRNLIDEAIPSGEMGRVLTLLGILLGAFALSVVASIRESLQTTHISGSVVVDLQRQMYDRLQDLPSSWYAGRTQGEVLSRLFQDVGAVQSGLTQALATGLFQSLSLLVSSVILLTLEWRLAIIVLVGAPIVTVIYRVMSNGARRRSTSLQEASSSLLGLAAENYQAQTVVKVFDLGGRERMKFARAASRVLRAQKRMSMFGEVFGLSVNTVVTLLRLSVMAVGAWLIFEGSFTLGGLVAFLGVVGEVLGPMTSLVGLGQQLQASSGALARVQDVLDLDPERPADAERPTLAPVASSIELRDVHFAYSGRFTALDGVSVRIAAGSKTAFVGPSGSGKSTVMRLLMRLDDPSAGQVLVDDVALDTVQLASWRAQLGVVMQDSFLFDTTIRDNIAMGLPGTDDRERSSADAAAVVAAADFAEVSEFAERLARGLDSAVGERGSALSGGQRQRVAIARASVRSPRVLLLDEATSALDPRTERQIADTIDRVAGGRTVIAVTHRLASVAHFDMIVVVDGGRFVEQGTHHQLLAADGLYARLWAEQHHDAERPSGFDAVAALAKVAVLADLDGSRRAELAARLSFTRLEPGDRMAEGRHIVFLAEGSADVEVPRGGRRVATARLAPGDAFGVAAALDAGTGAELVAREPSVVAVLEDDSWRPERRSQLAQPSAATFGNEGSTTRSSE